MLRYGEIVWARLPPSLQSYHQRCLKLSVAYNSHRLPGVFRPNEYASLTSGMYWWPGELVHPQHLPTNKHSVKDDGNNNNSQTFAINFQPTSNPTLPTSNNILGSVFVRLYGLTNSLSTKHSRPVYLLTTRARLFPYEEGDDKRRGSSSRNISVLDDTTIGEVGERGKGTCRLEEWILIQTAKERRFKTMQELARRYAPAYPKQNTKPHHPGENQTRRLG
ncbi:unnamed protein product [Trichobilharzia regenti]|nr:unnamed protein product [Trichobilharzia regenti]